MSNDDLKTNSKPKQPRKFIFAPSPSPVTLSQDSRVCVGLPNKDPQVASPKDKFTLMPWQINTPLLSGKSAEPTTSGLALNLGTGGITVAKRPTPRAGQPVDKCDKI